MLRCDLKSVESGWLIPDFHFKSVKSLRECKLGVIYRGDGAIEKPS
jgi:hypothetical protein